MLAGCLIRHLQWKDVVPEKMRLTTEDNSRRKASTDLLFSYRLRESLNNVCPNAMVAIWCSLVLALPHSICKLRNPYYYTRCLWTFLWSTEMYILGKRQIRNASGNISGLSWLSNGIFTWVNFIKTSYMMDVSHNKFYLSNTLSTYHFLVSDHDVVC